MMDVLKMKNPTHEKRNKPRYIGQYITERTVKQNKMCELFLYDTLNMRKGKFQNKLQR